MKIYILYHLDDEYGHRDFKRAFASVDSLKSHFKERYPTEVLHSIEENYPEGFIYDIDELEDFPRLISKKILKFLDSIGD